jgi:hypothetical protein
MPPTFSGRPISEHLHLRCPKRNTQRPMPRTTPKGQTGKAKVPENAIGETPGFGFRILWEVRRPAVSKNRFVHCLRPESGVRYHSAQK